MNRSILAWVIGAAMAAASAVAYVATPRIMLADTLPKIVLERDIPKQIGEWKADDAVVFAVVDPQLQATVDAIYNDTLSRVYVNRAGERIFLSLAYSRNRSEDANYHVPEVCYPAQGFNIATSADGSIQASGKQLPVKLLVATRDGMYEPITYWIAVGQATATNGTNHKLAQMRYGLAGQIPDGMIVRVSSRTDQLDDQAKAREYAMQQRFLDDLSRALPQGTRSRLFGGA